MPSTNAHEPISVLLISNYAPDQQRSMLRFAELLASGLKSKGVDIEVYEPPVIFGKLGAKPSGLGKWIGYIDKYLIFPFLLRKKLRSNSKPDIVHICDHSNSIYSETLKGVPHLVTCHDILAIRAARGEFPNLRIGWSGKLQQQWILNGLSKSNFIVNVSAATRNDVETLLGPSKACNTIIPNALEACFLENDQNEEPQTSPFNTATRYLLHVGSNAWYKNRSAVLELFKQLAAEDTHLCLVLVGPELTQTELSKFGANKRAARIHVLNGLSDTQLKSLYQNAELLLFPSIIEGFGWPIIEAQACGCPVATLDKSPMNELNVIEELLLPAPDETDDWASEAAAQCRAVLQATPDERANLVAPLTSFTQQFALEGICEQYLELYHSILKAETE